MSGLSPLERRAAVRGASPHAEWLAPRVELTCVRDGARSWLLVTPAWTAALGLSPANLVGESYVSQTGQLLALDMEQDAPLFMDRFGVEFGMDHKVQELRADMRVISDWVALHPFAQAA